MNAPLQASSPAPIAALFSEHGDFVFRTLQYLGVPGPSLDDGLQDVFVTAHRRWDAFEGRSTPRTWLYGIARRVAFRHRRKDENHRRRFVLTERIVEGVDTPFEQAHARRSVQALLESLDENKRAAFVLTEVEGFTAAEAAELLEVPLGTVYSRVRAAWTRLREAAQEDVQVASMQVEIPKDRRVGLQRAVVAACIPSASIGTVATASTGLGAMGWVWGVAALGIVGLGVGVAMRPKAPVSEPAVDGSEPALEPKQPETPPRAAQAAVQSSPNPALEPVAPEPRVEAKPPARAPSQKPKPVSQSPEVERPASTLLEELALLRKAKELARDGKPDAARAVLNEHARRFADGELSEERREVRRSLATSDPEQGSD